MVRPVRKAEFGAFWGRGEAPETDGPDNLDFFNRSQRPIEDVLDQESGNDVMLVDQHLGIDISNNGQGYFAYDDDGTFSGFHKTPEDVREIIDGWYGI